MTYQDLAGGDDEERVVVNIECSNDTFEAWKDFADGYTSYEDAVLDAHRTWDVIHSGVFSRGEFDGADNPGSEKSIFIRCSAGTRQKFKEFAAGYADYEAAAEDVVHAWREAPNYFKGRATGGPD